MPCPHHSSRPTLCAAGDPDYFDVRIEFYKNKVNGILFVFDVTNEKSFESLGMWFEEADKYGISSETVKIVVGNKIDLYPREVTEQQVNNISIQTKLSPASAFSE